MENQPRFKNLPKEERMILYNGLVYQKNLIETGNPFLDISEAFVKNIKTNFLGLKDIYKVDQLIRLMNELMFDDIQTDNPYEKIVLLDGYK